MSLPHSTSSPMRTLSGASPSADWLGERSSKRSSLLGMDTPAVFVLASAVISSAVRLPVFFRLIAMIASSPGSGVLSDPDCSIFASILNSTCGNSMMFCLEKFAAWV